MRISVAICTWNGERFLRQQLESMLRQTRLPDEIVLRDDASSDRTVPLAKEILSHAGMDVDILVQPHNVGSNANFQDAIRSCTGDVVFLSDQDDFWLPNKVETMIDALEASPSAGWAFSDLSLCDASLSPRHRSMWQDIGFDPKLRRAYAVDPLDALLRRPLVTGAATAFRRDAIQQAFPFPPDWVHDHWLSLFLTAMGARGIAIDKPLVLYRTHQSQQIGTKNNSVGAKFRKIMSVGPKEYMAHALIHVELANRLRRSGAPERSLRLVESAALHHSNRGKMAGSSVRRRIELILEEMRTNRYRFSAQPRFSWIKDLIGFASPG